jgi:hypothetical protein
VIRRHQVHARDKMSGHSTRKKLPFSLIYPRALHRLIPLVLFLSGMAGLHFPDPTWATVYECVDAAGKTVLTNRQSGFRKCRALTDMTQPEHGSSRVSPPMTEANPPIDSDLAPPLSENPSLPRHRPADRHDSSMTVPSAPNSDGSSSPSPSQPCQRGLNPLNPLLSPPCPQSEQSGASPSGTAPASPQ